jgi:hypothetical protein
MGDPSTSNITAWVRKKVPELVGMEEPDLVEFIMGHVRQHASAGEWAGVQRVTACGSAVVLEVQRCRVVAAAFVMSDPD